MRALSLHLTPPSLKLFPINSTPTHSHTEKSLRRLIDHEWSTAHTNAILPPPFWSIGTHARGLIDKV